MKVFITSGGTKVPLDPVRSITNMSKGTFGSKIATEFLNNNHQVFYYTAKNAISPFSMEIDFYKSTPAIEFKRDWCKRIREKGNYFEYRFVTYKDYVSNIYLLLDMFDPDVIILAAAVSDYSTKQLDEKIRSSNDLTIDLKPTQKIIKSIKKRYPKAFLVGFKLLVNSNLEELIDESFKSIETNQCDMVVANDLNSIKEKNHQIVLVRNSNYGKVIRPEVVSIHDIEPEKSLYEGIVKMAESK